MWVQRGVQSDSSAGWLWISTSVQWDPVWALVSAITANDVFPQPVVQLTAPGCGSVSTVHP